MLCHKAKSLRQEKKSGLSEISWPVNTAQKKPPKEPVDMIENYIRYCNNHRARRNLGVLTPMEKYNLYLAA